MRFYKLLIDGKPLLELNKDNPLAPMIDFSIKQYESGDTPNVQIILYNMSIEFLIKSEKFLGKRLELYAGVDESPITKAMGIQKIQNNLMCRGFIGNIIVNPYAEKDNSNQVILVLRQSDPTKESETVLLDIKKGDGLKNKIKGVLSQLYAESSIQVSGAEKVTDFEEQIKISSYTDLWNFADKYKINLYRTRDGFLITDPKAPAERVTTLRLTDFLEQPRLIRISTIECSLNLRGDLYLGTVIEIPQQIFASIPPNADFMLAKPKAYIVGQFRITKVWNIGKSRNTDAQSWATNFEATALESGK